MTVQRCVMALLQYNAAGTPPSKYLRGSMAAMGQTRPWATGGATSGLTSITDSN